MENRGLIKFCLANSGQSTIRDEIMQTKDFVLYEEQHILSQAEIAKGIWESDEGNRDQEFDFLAWYDANPRDLMTPEEIENEEIPGYWGHKQFVFIQSVAGQLKVRRFLTTSSIIVNIEHSKKEALEEREAFMEDAESVLEELILAEKKGREEKM